MAAALWNTFANPAAGPSLFERMGVAGHNGASGNGSAITPQEARADLRGAITDSRSQAAAGVASGRSGVQAVLDGRLAIDRAVGDMRNAAGDMRGAANAMLPIADTMRGEGDALFDSGTKITEQALATLGTGLGFINMDSSASPLVAEAIRQFGEVDPDRYVATAAQDVQSQFDNARAQGERELARRGVNPTSGAALALNALRDRALAVARSSAMFRARERGLNDRMSAFDNLILKPANTFLQTGGQLASVGTTARAQGVNAQQGAANVLGDAGNLFGGAGRLIGSAGELGLNYDKTLMGAYNALAGLQLDQARNTQSTEALRVNAVNGGGGRSQSGGVNVIDNTDRAVAARIAAGAKDPIVRFK